MTKLSWNEIRSRAIQFSREWEDAERERSESQSFWNDFFEVFGIRRRTVASFEEPVKTLKDTYGFIDLFVKGTLLAEHKSKGASLDKAEIQAFQYIQDLFSSGREDEVPRYIVVSDFARLVLYDLEPEDQGELFAGIRVFSYEFPLHEFHRNVKHFAFLIGQKTHRFHEEDPANLEAAQIMADLHDTIEHGGYEGSDLEQLLVRLLFCLFADDTGIFEKDQFQLLIENRTIEDGSDLGAQLAQLFDVLDTPEEERQENLSEDFADFPYINGELFQRRLRFAAFNRDMRNRLLAATRFDWSRISPAIFGSLFQGIMDAKERRQIGAHYTSERDILKVIRPLFLDELHAEFENICAFKNKTQRDNRLLKFQKNLAELQLLDPACGCGNFLVIAYRELRRLELEVLKVRHGVKKSIDYDEIDLGEFAKWSMVDVDQFYGIEIGEWPCRIAETALWLTDHQMNTELSEAFGNIFQRIPLRAAPRIRCANALRIDWNDVLPAKKCSYVFGNPPFVGHHNQTSEQKSDQHLVLHNIKARGVLDYVSNWYVKAAGYIDRLSIEVAFVSTNSISQGEQPSILWNELYGRYRLKIIFVHRTFAWESEARGKAHVHVVILGFATKSRSEPVIYEYESLKSEPTHRSVSRINPYLVEGPEIVVTNRSKPLCAVPGMKYGNKPTDGGNLILSEEEYGPFLNQNPTAEKYLRPLMSAHEFLHGKKRWCLWLVDATPNDMREIQGIRKRVEAVRAFRLESKAESTRKYASMPTIFRQITQPESDYILVPIHTSERRVYIPFGFFPQSHIVHNSCCSIGDTTSFHFGILTSTMHMAWVKQVCGRLKSDYRYTKDNVYNNFPWPVDATDAQRAKVEACAQAVLDARQPYLDQGQTLADLYDPLTMPADLLKAHQALDRAVDRCYRAKKFESERERVEHLFQLYEQLTSPLAPTEKKKKRKGAKTQRKRKPIR